MLRWATLVVVASVTTLAAFEGCGSSSGNNAGAPDASANDASNASDGGSKGDAPGEAAVAEAGPDCGAVPPSGTQLVPSTDPLVVFTLTVDHVIYENLTTQELYGVPIDGGTPSDIGKMQSQSSTVWAHGSSLLYLPVETDPMTAIGPLSSWTPTGGTSVISTSALAEDAYDYTYDVSKDGQWVAYYETGNGLSATLTVSTIDGKTQTPVVTAVDLDDVDVKEEIALCNPPVLQFVNDTLVAQFCKKEANDAGVTADAVVMAFTAPTFTPVLLGTYPVPAAGVYLGPIAFDPTGTSALLLDPSGVGLSLYPLAGGTPVPIDPKGTAGIFASNGDVLYTNTDTALVRYATATGTTTTLVTSGLTLPLDLSPDGNWLQIAAGESSDDLTNLYIASATTPGPVNTVVKSETAGAVGFSANSAYSLFGTGFSTMFGPSSYALQSSTIDGGAVKVLNATGGSAVYSTSGSKLVVPTNVNISTGATDIVSVDLSSTGAPTALVTQVDPNIFQTSTKAIVYSWYCQENGTSGIWTLTPP